MCVQREAAEVHVAHGGDSHSAVEKGEGKKSNKSKITGGRKDTSRVSNSIVCRTQTTGDLACLCVVEQQQQQTGGTAAAHRVLAEDGREGEGRSVCVGGGCSRALSLQPQRSRPLRH